MISFFAVQVGLIQGAVDLTLIIVLYFFCTKLFTLMVISANYIKYFGFTFMRALNNMFDCCVRVFVDVPVRLLHCGSIRVLETNLLEERHRNL